MHTKDSLPKTIITDHPHSIHLSPEIKHSLDIIEKDKTKLQDKISIETATNEELKKYFKSVRMMDFTTISSMLERNPQLVNATYALK